MPSEHAGDPKDFSSRTGGAPVPPVGAGGAQLRESIWRRHWSVPASVWVAIAVVLCLAVNAMVTPHFFRLGVQNGRFYGSLVDVMENGAPVMLMAIGMTLVIACAGIDLSVGSTAALSGTIAAILLTSEYAVPAPVAVVVAIVVGVLIGALNGVVVSAMGIQPIIATLVSLVVVRGAAQSLSDNMTVGIESEVFAAWFNGTVLGMPVPIIIVVLALAAALVGLRCTPLGLYVEAVGTNARAARLCGVRVRSLKVLAYAASGLCAAVAGLVLAADVRLADPNNAGMYTELDAILAVVLGGTPLTGGKPRVVGTILGAALMQMVTVSLQMHGIPTDQTLMFKALVTILVCLTQAPRLRAFAGNVKVWGKRA